MSDDFRGAGNVASVPPELTPMLQTATSAVEVGTTGLFLHRPHGQLARPAEAGTFTRAGTADATAVAAVLLRHAQLSQVALH